MVRHHTPSLSFEVFPPNPAVGNEKIIQALREMPNGGDCRDACRRFNGKYR